MKQTLLIIALFIGLGNVNAQSDATKTVEDEWNETIDWIKSKSSYYNIQYFGQSWGTTIDEKQVFNIYNDFSFSLIQTEMDTSKKWIYKGNLIDINSSKIPSIKEHEEDFRVSSLDVPVSCEMKYASTPFEYESEFRLVILNKDDMPQRLKNAFTRLSEIRYEYQAFLKKKEEQRINSYGEKF